MAISLNDKEMLALSGLPHFLVCLYVMALRPRMDFKTAMVGIRPRISWQALGEWLYVEPAAGRTDSGSPHKSSIRRGVEQLQKVGLIQSRGNADSLVFFLPMANADFSEQKKPDTNPTPHPDTKNTLNKLLITSGYGDKKKQPDTPKTAEPDTHPISDIKTKPTPPTPPAGGEAVEVELIFSPTLTAAMQQTIRKTLTSKGIPVEHWQMILDEYHGQQGIRPINNPAAYIRRLAERLAAGEFVGELAEQVAEQREKRKAQIEQNENQKRVLQEEGRRSSPRAADLALLPAGLRLRLSNTLGKG